MLLLEIVCVRVISPFRNCFIEDALTLGRYPPSLAYDPLLNLAANPDASIILKKRLAQLAYEFTFTISLNHIYRLTRTYNHLSQFL